MPAESSSARRRRVHAELVGVIVPGIVRESSPNRAASCYDANGGGPTGCPNRHRRGALGLEGDRGSVAPMLQPALLAAQDRQRAQQAAQEPALEGKACSPDQSGWPRPGTTQTAPSTPSSRPRQGGRLRDRATMLAFYDFPAEHWKHLAPPTPSKAQSPPCDTVPCIGMPLQQDGARHGLQTRPGGSRTVGAASTDTTSCPS